MIEEAAAHFGQWLFLFGGVFVQIPIGKYYFPDPALSFRFYIPALPFDLPPQFVKGVTLNFPQIEDDPHQVGPLTQHYPGNLTVDSITIAFNETADYLVADRIQYWRRLALDERGVYGLPINYKKDLVICLLDSARPVVRKVVQYTQCWPGGLPPHTYDVGTSEALVSECTFNVERCYTF